MNAIPTEAKVLRNLVEATRLFIKTGDVVIQTEYAELAQCDFPIWSSPPIPVEIPPSGTKDFIVGPFAGGQPRNLTADDYPHTIKFPVYLEQDVVSPQEFQRLAAHGNAQALAKVPIVALAAGVCGVVDGKTVQTHCVLPIWADGSTVLVQLDWFEGEPSEGTPNPEWHLRASTGLPIDLGLKRLERESRLPSNAEHCRYDLYLTPWRLGAQLLADEGKELEHRIWKRQWSFSSQEELSSAVTRIAGGLNELGLSVARCAR